MSDQEINKAIAEACGWKLTREDDGEFCLINSSGKRVAADWGPKTTIQSFAHILPDYCNDLNAMRDALESMHPAMIDDYAMELQRILSRHYFGMGKKVQEFSQLSWFFAFNHATARQRAEAFLRSLNLWKE